MSDFSHLPSLEDLPADALASKPVFVRVDFNVPMRGNTILDTTRIDAALPTLTAILQRGGRPILATHRGRPKGAVDPSLSLEPVARALTQRLRNFAGLDSHGPVRFCPSCIGPEAEEASAQLGEGEVLLLENLRFHAGEKANDPEFVKALSQLSQVYVNDAFGTAHRAHASTVGLPRVLHSRAAGLLLHKEVRVLSTLLDAPPRPFLAILGGAKISGKLETLQRLVESVDALAVGGGMANTLLAARGVAMGSSLVEEDLLGVAKEILDRCAERSVKVLLPSDLVVTTTLDGEQAAERTIRVLDRDSLGDEEMAVDIGPASAASLAQAVHGAAAVFWNGPLGVFEQPPYDAGSVAVAEGLARCPGFTVVGGGETVAAIKAAGAVLGIDHISTGGGASLDLLAGKTLPAVEALGSIAKERDAPGQKQ